MTRAPRSTIFKGVWTLARVTAEGVTLPADAAEMAGDTLVVYGDTCDLTLQGIPAGRPDLPHGRLRAALSVLDGECRRHAARGRNALVWR